jgi:hypothetical protein
MYRPPLLNGTGHSSMIFRQRLLTLPEARASNPKKAPEKMPALGQMIDSAERAKD